MHTHSTKFCFCIPVRLGVTVIALLALLLSVLVAGVGWYSIASNTYAGTDMRPTLWAYSIEYSILAVVSLLGLLGALCKQRHLVTIFEYYLIVSLLIGVAVSVWSLIVVFRVYDAVYDKYKDDPNMMLTKPLYVKIISIVTLVLESSLILYGIIVVRRYKYQLWDDEKQKWHQNPQFEAPKEDVSQQQQHQQPGYLYQTSNQSAYPFTAPAIYPPVSNAVAVDQRISYQPVATADRV